jgi:proteasome lid subunit RPN8/RPN11
MTAVDSTLTEAVTYALIKRAQHAYPFEVCGFIVSGWGGQFVYEVPNVAPNRRHSFQMHPGYQMLAMTDQTNIVGMWHSHPAGPDGPSGTDVKFKPPGMRAFVVTENGVFEYGLD